MPFAASGAPHGLLVIGGPLFLDARGSRGLNPLGHAHPITTGRLGLIQRLVRSGGECQPGVTSGGHPGGNPNTDGKRIEPSLTRSSRSATAARICSAMVDALAGGMP